MYLLERWGRGVDGTSPPVAWELIVIIGREMINIGLDVGYYATKVNSDKHAPVSFPSGASEYRGTGFMEPALLEYANSDMAYVVGQELELGGGIVQRRHDRDWIHTDLYKMLTDRALAAMLDPGHSSEVRVVTGLPYQFYKADRDSMVDNLRGDHIFFFNEEIYRVEVKDVIVIPQGIGALLDVAVNFSGNVIDTGFLQGRIGILDIGSRTVNGVEAKQLKITGSTFSADSGTWNVVKQIARELELQFPSRRLSPFETEQAIQEKQITLYGETHDISEIVQSIVSEGYVDNLVGIISANWGETSQLDHILLVGGGAYLAGDVLKEHYPHVEVAKNPVFANTNGYIKYVRVGA